MKFALTKQQGRVRGRRETIRERAVMRRKKRNRALVIPCELLGVGQARVVKLPYQVLCRLVDFSQSVPG